MDHIVFCYLGYSDYSGRFLYPSEVQGKVEFVPEIRAVDEGAISLEVEIPDEVMDGDDVRNLQEETITTLVMIR